MAVSRFVLKMLPGIGRPAIIARCPACAGALMCSISRERRLRADTAAVRHHGGDAGRGGGAQGQASVGLLNIGEEDIKGNDVVKRAAELLRESELNFIGNIEADGNLQGGADVVCATIRRQRHAQGVRGNGADGAQLIRRNSCAAFSPGWPA